MSKAMIIGMMVGGVFLFIVIIGLLVIGFSSPVQAPQSGINQGPIDGAANGTENDSGGGQFQGIDDGQQVDEYRDAPSFDQGAGFGGGDSSGGKKPLSTVDSEYGQLPSGEFKDDYVAPAGDEDNNGFIDFQRGAGGF